MYWVTMTDKFMSGWGEARGKINKLVITCNTYDEALIVADNAEAREEMKYVNIRYTKPYYTSSRYYVSWHGKEQDDYQSWFEKGYFIRENG